MLKYALVALFFAAAAADLDVCFVPDKLTSCRDCFVPDKTTCLDKVVDIIDNSKNYIRIMSYSFTLSDIVNSLCKAKDRGVDVEVLIDKGAARSKKAITLLTALQACGGRVYVDNSSVPIAHNKIMMVDNTTMTTGSVNWSANGFFKNAENMLIIRNDPIFYKYMDNFLKRSKNRKPFVVSLIDHCECVRDYF